MSSDNGRRGSESKNSINLPIIAIIIILSFALGTFFLSSIRTHSLSWSDFNQLLDRLEEAKSKKTNSEPTVPTSEPEKVEAKQSAEKTTVEKPAVSESSKSTEPTSAKEQSSINLNTVFIDVPQGSNRTYRYRTLRRVVVGERLITGHVTYQEVDKAGKGFGTPSEVAFRTKKDPSDVVTDKLWQKLAAAGISAEPDGGPSFWDRYGFLLIVTALLIFFAYKMLTWISGAGSPMQFGRSKGRIYVQEEIKVTFDDVAGIDEAVEEVREIVEFLSSPEKYQRLGGHIPKGVLLVGPPGTGKTLLAKAIAGEAGVPFFSLSGSDFVEMFVGVGAARVRDLFQQAQSKAPCIIFIDELDALGKARGGSSIGGHDEREQTLNALLVEMDGFDSNAGVIVMAATNRPETLDKALLRRGRFDRQVLVDRPDVRGREAILKVHVKNVKMNDAVDLKHVAAISSGFSGADLASIVNEAALLAARAGKDSVEMSDFDEGVERVTAGLEKKQRVMDEDERLRVAYHEAGHALVAYSLPNTDPVHKVSIIPRGFAALGYTMQRPEQDRYLMTQSELESQIQILLAGIITEEMIFQDVSTGAQNDLQRSTDLVRAMVSEYGMSRLGLINYADARRSAFLETVSEDSKWQCSERTAREIDEEVKRIVDEMANRTRNVLEVRRAALVAVAEKLVEVESLDSAELKRIVEAASPGPLVVPGTIPSVSRRLSQDVAVIKPEPQSNADVG